MSIRLLFAVCVGLNLLATCACAVPTVEDGKLVIAGKVLLPDGSPAAGAIVEAQQDRSRGQNAAAADQLGEFELRGVFGNGARLCAQSAGGELQRVRMVASTDARIEFSKPLELTLEPATAHRVAVTAGGDPAADVRVVALGSGFKVRGRTDEQGAVLLYVPAGEELRQVAAWHPSLGVAGSGGYSSPIQGSESNLALLAPANHVVKVVNEQGNPVVGVDIAASFRTQSSEWMMTGDIAEANVMTNEQGEAHLPWAPRDQLLYVDADVVGREWMVYDSKQTQVHQRLSQVFVTSRMLGQPVVGRILVADGESATGMLVAGTSDGPGNRFDRVYARVDNEGQFAFGVPVNYATGLAVSDREYSSDFWAGVVRTTQDATPADVELRAYRATPATITVTRGAERQSVANAWVEVSHRCEITYQRDGKDRTTFTKTDAWLQTDAEGKALAGLSRGENRVRLSSPNWSDEQSFNVTTDNPVQIEFHRPWVGQRRVKGRLRMLGEDYAPASELAAITWDPDYAYGSNETQCDVNENGAFVLQFDREKLAVLIIDPLARLSGYAEVDINTKELMVTMQAAASYFATLVDDSGTPLADWEVGLEADGGNNVAAPVKTDAQGVFGFPFAPSGVALSFRLTGPDGERNYYVGGRQTFAEGEIREESKLTASRSDH